MGKRTMVCGAILAPSNATVRSVKISLNLIPATTASHQCTFFHMNSAMSWKQKNANQFAAHRGSSACGSSYGASCQNRNQASGKKKPQIERIRSRATRMTSII